MTPTPRRFVSLTRTVLSHGYLTLDAIDEDGRAWWMVIGDDVASDQWVELQPLPSREERP